MARGFSVGINIGANLLPSLMTAPTKVEETFAKMSRGIKVRAAETRVALKEMTEAMSPLAGMAIAGGLSVGLHGIFGEGAEYTHQISMMRLAGRTSTEMARAIAQANKTMMEVPTTTLNDNLETLNHTVMAFGSVSHALDNLSFVQKLNSMSALMLGDKAGDPSSSAYSLIKAMEMRGMGTPQHKGFDSGRFQREAGYMYQAMIASGGKVNPEELFNFVKMANPYAKGLSNRFMYRIAPSLVQENGGDSSGTMLNTFMGTLLGKAKNKISTEAWLKLGLLDPKQVIYNKVGPVGWKPGAIKNTNDALYDPLSWVEGTLIPALRSHGYNTGDQLSMAKALMPLFRDRNAQRMASMLASDNDNARLHKDEGLISKVPTIGKGYADAMMNDPKLAAAAAAASLKNLETTIGKAVTPQVTSALANTARAINWLAAAFDNHPNFARGLVGLMGLGAVTATLKVFGVALRWVLSPLKLLFAPLRMLGTAFKDTFGPSIARGVIAGGRAILSGIGRFAPLILRGLVALGPPIAEGLLGLAAAVSNPIGWTLIAVTIVGTLAFAFRKQLAAMWPKIKATFAGLDWASVGTSIAIAVADALTLGLASKMPAVFAGLRSHLPSWAGGSSTPPVPIAPKAAPAKLPPVGAMKAPPLKAPVVAGHRAFGGPVWAGRTYLVGEHGPELFRAPSTGAIMPHGASGRLLAAQHGHKDRATELFAASRPARREEAQRDRRNAGGNVRATFHIHGATDPKETARVVHKELKNLARAQAYLLSD